MSVDNRDDLSHVLWVGGGPRSGTTTISRLLAGKYDLKIYLIDWHYWREHQERLVPERHPVSTAMRHATADAWWVEPSVQDIVQRAIALWSETFEFVVDDLKKLPRSRLVLAEGPGAFPWLVAPLLSSVHQAVFLTPTPDFRDAVLAAKLGTNEFGGETRDPKLARSNHRAHDVELTNCVEASCAALGLRAVHVDGLASLGETAALVEEHFRPHLPETMNV